MSDKLNINVNKFFMLYNSDEALRERIRLAKENYPGSWEQREALAADVLLPVAEELGLPFSIMDLFVYESRLKQSRNPDEEITEVIPEENYVYWLVDRGWKNDESRFCGEG